MLGRAIALRAAGGATSHADSPAPQVQRAIEVGTVPFLLQVVRSFYDLVYPGVRRLVDSYYNGTRHMPDYARDIPNYLPRTRYINEALVALREIVYCDPWQCEGEVRGGEAMTAPRALPLTSSLPLPLSSAPPPPSPCFSTCSAWTTCSRASST